MHPLMLLPSLPPPQFGPGAIQLHGFARNVDWSLAASKNDGGNPAVSLVLTDTDYTRAMWPHSFKVGCFPRWGGEVLDRCWTGAAEVLKRCWSTRMGHKGGGVLGQGGVPCEAP